MNRSSTAGHPGQASRHPSVRTDSLRLSGKRDSLYLKKIIRHATFAAALLATGAASAIEAGGVRFDDRISLSGSELVANGAGVRRKFVFDVYAIALYLPARAASSDAATSQNAPRRIAVQLLRDVGAVDFVDALRSGIQENVSAAEFAALKPQIQQFADTLLVVKEVSKGTLVQIDYLPASGTRVTIAGQVRGKDIPGEAFYAALLKIWLGGKPVQADLKDKLLGR